MKNLILVIMLVLMLYIINLFGIYIDWGAIIVSSIFISYIGIFNIVRRNSI